MFLKVNEQQLFFSPQGKDVNWLIKFVYISCFMAPKKMSHPSESRVSRLV